jgi:hypothetical protein
MEIHGLTIVVDMEAVMPQAGLTGIGVQSAHDTIERHVARAIEHKLRIAEIDVTVDRERSRRCAQTELPAAGIRRGDISCVGAVAGDVGQCARPAGRARTAQGQGFVG